MPFSTLAVPFDQYAALPTAQHRWVLMALARYADRDGRCWPSMRQIARDARMSVASVCRYLRSLADLGVFQRSRSPGMRYRYRLAEAYVPRWPGRVSSAHTTVSTHEIHKAGENKQRSRYAAYPDQELTISHDDSSRWEARLRAWQRNGFWPVFAGPKPGERGCFVPAEILAAMR